MGSETGATALRLADEFPATEVLGIDNRETVIELSRAKNEELGLSNVSFETADMIEFVTTSGSLPKMVVLLYSFHHIPDPLQQKIDFLRIAVRISQREDTSVFRDIPEERCSWEHCRSGWTNDVGRLVLAQLMPHWLFARYIDDDLTECDYQTLRRQRAAAENGGEQ